MKRLVVFLLLLSGCAAAQTATPHRRRVPKPVTPALPAVTQPTAVLDTSAGRMICTLLPEKAPNSVANFAGLATGAKEWVDPASKKKMAHKPLYNGTIFHRVIPNFMIQGGDPMGTGDGGPGFEMNDEISDLKFDLPGRMAYANSGPNTNGSQFFITEVPTPWLDGHYTIFGQCDEHTVDLVKDIARRARDTRNDRPYDPVVVNKVTILGYKVPGAAAHAVAHKQRSTAKPAAH